MNSQRLCFACDLKDDPSLMKLYKAHHAPGKVWSEIISSIKDAGILDMEIYLVGNRMFMIMEVDECYTPEKKAEIDLNNPKVQEWEELMWTFQQALPWSKPDEKWVSMERIFKLD